MPTSKTFEDFMTVATDNDELLPGDYLVGYRSTAVASDEVKVKAQDLVASIDTLASSKSIRADKLYYIPSSVAPNVNVLSVSVEDKLNQLRTVSDFPTVRDAAKACAGQRLLVDKEIELYIPDDGYTQLSEALTAIQNWVISDTGKITLVVTSDLVVYGPINLNHQYGSRIQIVGRLNNTTEKPVVSISPTLVSFNFDVFKCSEGHSFSLIDNLIILGPSSVNYGTYSAILADTGSQINLGSSLYVGDALNTGRTSVGFYVGIKAQNGSSIYAAGSKVANCGYAGFVATNGSQIYANDSSSVYNTIAGTEIGYGYIAQHGSQITADGATASSNRRAGFAAFSSSQIKAYGSTSNNNGVNITSYGSGFYAKDCSQIECLNISDTQKTTATGNKGYCFEIGELGNIVANTDNANADVGLGIFNKRAKLTLSNDGSTPTLKTETAAGSSDLAIDAGSGKIVFKNDIQFGTFTSTNNSPLSSTGYILVYDKNNVARKLLVG